MDFFLQDPNETRLPPEQVRIRELQVTPQPGGKKVKVHLELTPFKKRPNVEVTIITKTGKQAAHTNVLEAMLNKMEFTMHLRQPEANGQYTIEVIIYYQKLPEPSEQSHEIHLQEPMIVDRRKDSFVIAHPDS